MPTTESVPYRFEVFEEYPNFCYYTLRAEGAERTLANQTLVELDSDPATSALLERFLEMMAQIGNRCRNIRERGMLRAEINARALPPEAWRWHSLPYLHELGHVPSLPSLRWYAYDADQRILLLFGGGLKTQNDPTACVNVEKHFRFANRASRYLDENRTDWATDGLALFLTDEDYPLYL